MTATCCARAGPPRCSGIACWRPRRWVRFCARSPSGTSVSSTGSSARRSSARGRRVPDQATGGWSSTSTPSSASVRAREAGRGVRLHPRPRLPPDPRDASRHRRGAAHPARKGSANTSRGFARFLDELLARVERAGATGDAAARADSGFWNKQTFAKLDRAGWQFSIGVRLQPAVRAAIDAIARTPGIDAAGLPEDLDRADRRDHPRRPPTGRSPRPHSRPPGPTAADLGAVSVPHQPHRRRSRSSRPSTASTPSSSSRSATSKTKRSRTSPPDASSPTPPGR